MLEVENGRVILNMASDGDGQTRRALEGLERLDVHGIPLLLVFFLLSRHLKRNDGQLELSLPNLRHGEFEE